MERKRSSRSSGGDMAAVDVAAQIELEWPFDITHYRERQREREREKERERERERERP